MLALALTQLNDINRISEWGDRLEHEFPEVFAQVKIHPAATTTYCDDIVITLLMAGYSFDCMDLNEGSFEVFAGLCEDVQTLFESVLRKLLTESKFPHVSILLRYKANPDYTHLCIICIPLRRDEPLSTN